MTVMCQLPNVYVTLPIDIAINAWYIIKIDVLECVVSICTYIITLDWPNGSRNTCKMGCLYPGKTSALHKHDVLSSTRLSSTCQLQLDVISRLFSLRGISLPPEGELSNCTSLLWYLSLVTQFPMKIKIRWERSPLLSPLICLYYDICLCSKIIFA